MTHPRLPQISRPLLGGFRVFVRWYLARHFHAVAIHGRSQIRNSIQSDDALLVYANHASWWDPLTAIFLADSLFPDFAMYAPIDAEALQKYRILERLGFFPVLRDSLRGAGSFLELSSSILTQPAASLWLTPEGQFADPRQTTLDLQSGLAHLAFKLGLPAGGAPSAADEGQAIWTELRTSGSPKVWFLPVAVEYTFWEERQPELLVWLGQPLCLGWTAGGSGKSKREWQVDLTDRLRTAQAELAAAAIARDATAFELVLGGRSGTFFLYDWWRGGTSWMRGRPSTLGHGSKFRRD